MRLSVLSSRTVAAIALSIATINGQLDAQWDTTNAFATIIPNPPIDCSKSAQLLGIHPDIMTADGVIGGRYKVYVAYRNGARAGCGAPLDVSINGKRPALSGAFSLRAVQLQIDGTIKIIDLTAQGGPVTAVMASGITWESWVKIVDRVTGAEGGFYNAPNAPTTQALQSRELFKFDRGVPSVTCEPGLSFPVPPGTSGTITETNIGDPDDARLFAKIEPLQGNIQVAPRWSPDQPVSGSATWEFRLPNEEGIYKALFTITNSNITRACVTTFEVKEGAALPVLPLALVENQELRSVQNHFSHTGIPCRRGGRLCSNFPMYNLSGGCRECFEAAKIFHR